MSTTSAERPSPFASATSSPISIAICGGGIGGLALAIGLLRHQHADADGGDRKRYNVHIYEAATAFAEIGAGVSFGPNAVRAMGLIDPQIREGYGRRSTKNGWESKKDAWFDFRWGMDLRGAGEGTGRNAGDYFHTALAPGTGQSSVHRAHFLDELVKLIPKECASFGKRVESLHELDSGRIRMSFHDGTTAEADAVIGCDGIKSHVRPSLLGPHSGAAQATFTGKYAYRGLIPMDKAVDLLGDELARNSQMYFGYGAHLLTFPIEQGRTMNVVAFKTSKSGTWEDERWVLPMKREDMERDFAEWGKDVKSILSLMEKPDVWALFNHPPAEMYFKGRICLLGDSAHASTPHQGAGAGMALEDAYILSNLLKVQSVDEIELAFKVYDAARRKRTLRLVTTSKEAGELYELQDPEAGDDMEKVKANLGERYKWIWDHNLEDDLTEATREMEKLKNA